MAALTMQTPGWRLWLAREHAMASEAKVRLIGVY